MAELSPWASGVPCLRCISSLRRLRTTVQSPRFSVIGPQEVQSASAETAYIGPGGGEEFVGAGSKLFRKNDEKLFAAARSDQDFGESELGYDGARQHFAHEQAEPLRAAGKIELVSRT